MSEACVRCSTSIIRDLSSGLAYVCFSCSTAWVLQPSMGLSFVKPAAHLIWAVLEHWLRLRAAIVTHSAMISLQQPICLCLCKCHLGTETSCTCKSPLCSGCCVPCSRSVSNTGRCTVGRCIVLLDFCTCAVIVTRRLQEWTRDRRQRCYLDMNRQLSRPWSFQNAQTGCADSRSHAVMANASFWLRGYSSCTQPEEGRAHTLQVARACDGIILSFQGRC